VILLLDDICETGGSLLKLQNVFLELGAREVRSAVCIRRTTTGASYHPTWSGFEFPGREWFVGYGMDDRNYHSTLPDIYTVTP
jgi:hypoxanthine phosphoribosyltransferase